MMGIETTFSLREGSIDRLAAASEETGITRRDILSALMNYVSRRSDLQPRTRGAVSYQKKIGGERYCRLHALLRQDEYEFFIDMRKALKMSVSHIIAYAIDHYLDRLIELMQKNPDNYLYHNYAMTQHIIDNVITWVYYWGIPPRLLVETS
jgi:hypothetical protein